MNLLVFALKEEDLLPDYPGFEKIYTGVGKVNAAMVLADVLSEKYMTGDAPDLVINFGTARRYSFEKRCMCTVWRILSIRYELHPFGY